jgi:hypothetical protein
VVLVLLPQPLANTPSAKLADNVTATHLPQALVMSSVILSVFCRGRLALAQPRAGVFTIWVPALGDFIAREAVIALSPSVPGRRESFAKIGKNTQPSAAPALAAQASPSTERPDLTTFDEIRRRPPRWKDAARGIPSRY